MKNKIQQEQTKRTKTEKENIRFLRYLLFKLRCRVVSLLAQMFQGLAHRRAGNFDHASERVVHFQDNKNRC